MNTSLREIYDCFATTYDKNRGLFDMTEVFDSFYNRLKCNSGRLLDIGCGAGEPFARAFIDKGWDVTGVDFSQRMLELAAQYTPEMQTIYADMRDISFDAESFNAITATYSLFHIPSEDHAQLFRNLYHWLQPDGQLLFTYATREYTGHEEFNGYKSFMEQQLFYSHTSPQKLYALLQRIGFQTVATEYRNIGGEIFLWVTVKKP